MARAPVDGSVGQFGSVATGLARNPLGIIALFIVLVYGFAALVTALGGGLTVPERLPLIYFMVAFPCLVLGVFAWLVARHSEKLFAPSDFKDESNFWQVRAAAALGAATRKDAAPASAADIDEIVETVGNVGPARADLRDWRTHVLWVDDNPQNNTHVQRAMEEAGLRFTQSLSTDDAVEKLAQMRFGAIISDMGRKEGPREGYVLLDKIRSERNTTPLFFFASSSTPQQRQEALNHGAQGSTNNPQELFQMVTQALLGRR